MKAWKYSKPDGVRLKVDLPSSLTEDKTVKVKIEKVLTGNFEKKLISGETDCPDGLTVGRFAVGVVSELFDADKSKFNRIDRVVIEPHMPCGNCLPCRNGKYAACENMQCLGQTQNGLLQDFITLPESCLHKIPEPLKSENALITEHVALAIHILDALRLEKGEHIAIFSGSKLGVILAQLASYYQAIPVLVDEDGDALAIASANNIYYAFNPKNCDVIKELFSITGGRRCEKVAYLANDASGVDDAVNACAFNAKLCVGGFVDDRLKINLPQALKKNITLCTARTGYGNYPSALNLFTNKVIKMSDFKRTDISFDKFDGEFPKIDAHELDYGAVVVNLD